jgi:hypothetical protein
MHHLHCIMFSPPRHANARTCVDRAAHLARYVHAFCLSCVQSVCTHVDIAFGGRPAVPHARANRSTADRPPSGRTPARTWRHMNVPVYLQPLQSPSTSTATLHPWPRGRTISADLQLQRDLMHILYSSPLSHHWLTSHEPKYMHKWGAHRCANDHLIYSYDY